MHFPISSARFFAKSHNLVFFHHHSDLVHRSRMTAEVNCVLQMKLNGSWHKRKEYHPQAVPGHGESVSGADERGKCEQKGNISFYRPVLNTCLSFSNSGKNPYDCHVVNRNCRRVKNPAEDTGINVVFNMSKNVRMHNQCESTRKNGNTYFYKISRTASPQPFWW